jgi:hypothetical protein
VREAITIIWKLSVLAELAVAIRLLLQGLGGCYPALLAASLVLPVKSTLLMVSRSAQYRGVWKLMAPLEWILTALIVFELFSWWTRSYPGIGRFGRLLLAGLLVLSIGISLLYYPAEWRALIFARDLQIYSYLQRFTVTTLGLFLIGTMFFFRSYPAPIPPNVVRASRILAGYLVALTLADLSWNFFGGRFVAYSNLGIVSTTLAAFLSWAVFLTRKGQLPAQIKPVSSVEKERIERINEELLSFMKHF